ncbi:hypothetical protein Glove_15g4 [Diversispora epigaea]|uniref:Protein kinase domain-containing protein n=1 Tax=Diversispora epigaea TaxID=1348612 RepID=A0A397JX36_9GLOM|nr:hypothetical protein Glove_15g4 [Diversispora epigaea]
MAPLGKKKEIDEFIQQTQLKATKCVEVIEWIPFDKFNNIEYLAKGGFGKVFKATWSDGQANSLKLLPYFAYCMTIIYSFSAGFLVMPYIATTHIRVNFFI